MPLARRAIVVGMDGASMELVRRMVDEGQMPNVGRLLAEGAWREVVGVFPTLTPPGWTALWTGSWPGTHGVMDFNIRARGKPLSETIWGINTRLSKSEYLWNAVERGRPEFGRLAHPQTGQVLARGLGASMTEREAFGPNLRRIRIQRGISLDRISEATKRLPES